LDFTQAYQAFHIPSAGTDHPIPHRVQRGLPDFSAVSGNSAAAIVK
jgi:hypothetical protein